MSQTELLPPGTLVVPRDDISGELIIWSSYRSDIEDVGDNVGPDNVLLVLKSRKPSQREAKSRKYMLTPEWKLGAYLILSSNGKKGWVGAGWVQPVS